MSSVHLRPGVDVMITIFCNFYQFAAEKIGVMIKRAQKFAVI
jgi:hypothetical protein